MYNDNTWRTWLLRSLATLVLLVTTRVAVAADGFEVDSSIKRDAMVEAVVADLPLQQRAPLRTAPSNVRSEEASSAGCDGFVHVRQHGIPGSETICVEPGTHTFIVEGIFFNVNRQTQWFKDGLHQETDPTCPFNFWADPQFSVAIDAETTIRADVYFASAILCTIQDLEEVHTWNVTIALPAGSCCIANDSPSCDNTDCSTDICKVDSFCCDIQWDAMCAAAACATPACTCSCSGVVGIFWQENPDGGWDLFASTTQDALTLNADLGDVDRDLPPDGTNNGLFSNGGAILGDSFVTIGGDPNVSFIRPLSIMPSGSGSQVDAAWFVVGGVAPEFDPATGYRIWLGRFSMDDCLATVGGAIPQQSRIYVGWLADAGVGFGVFNIPLNSLRAPPGCLCPWDLDTDTVVGITDFLVLLAAWGTDPGGPPDFDGDGDVGINDFLELLANWGPCP